MVHFQDEVHFRIVRESQRNRQHQVLCFLAAISYLVHLGLKSHRWSATWLSSHVRKGGNPKPPDLYKALRHEQIRYGIWGWGITRHQEDGTFIANSDAKEFGGQRNVIRNIQATMLSQIGVPIIFTSHPGCCPTFAKSKTKNQSALLLIF